jgi:hypothetical protein
VSASEWKEVARIECTGCMTTALITVTEVNQYREGRLVPRWVPELPVGWTEIGPSLRCEKCSKE